MDESSVESSDLAEKLRRDDTVRLRQRHLFRLGAAMSAMLAMLASFLGWYFMIHMPGESYHGELPELVEDQVTLREQLEADVEMLAVEIGERNLRDYAGLQSATQYIEEQFRSAGYVVNKQEYEVRGHTCFNLEAEIPGATKHDEIVVVGAHYDSAVGTPGANDNASGTAAMLALARYFYDQENPPRTLRFVAFTNEEPPYFQSEDMGSLVYARRCGRRNENIVAAISLETIGYFSDRDGSQHYPAILSAFYPSEGNFIGVVGNVGSRQLVLQIVESFRRNAKFPAEGGALPGDVTGVGYSDHWSFWQEGYPAVMITDTAMFRYPYYHRPGDTPDKLDFDRMARVVDGLKPVIKELCQ